MECNETEHNFVSVGVITNEECGSVYGVVCSKCAKAVALVGWHVQGVKKDGL